MTIRVGCQTYTWQMHGVGWLGRLDEILHAIAAAGYDGVETTWQLLGPLLDRPERAARMLEARGLKLAALALSPPTGWSDPAAEADELALAERAIGFLGHFPGARLALGGGRSLGGRPPDPAAYDARFSQMLRMYHHVAERALSHGVRAHVHPTSTPDSLILVKAEYERLVAGLDPALAALGPDTAHVTRGDEPALEFIGRHADRIVHIHLKDAYTGGDYVPMGTGDADVPAVARLLAARGYDGWFVAEEESEASGADPAAAVASSREFLRGLGY